MTRPKLSEESFLKHLFSPAKNPLPTGIRQTKLVGEKGRIKRRLTAYNRMSPKSQEILRQSGMREQYLTGTASLAEAKGTLKVRAGYKGYRKVPTKVTTPETGLDSLNAGHMYRTLHKAGRPVDMRVVQRNIKYLPAELKPGFTTWSLAQIRAYSADDENAINVNGRRINPGWYHPG